MCPDQQKPLSTRDTTVKCCACGHYFPVDKSVYGVSPYAPLMMPDHFCKRDAIIYRVVDYSPMDVGGK